MAISTPIRQPVLPNEQKPMGAPVVNAPALPAMETIGEVKTVLRNTALPLMAADPGAEIRGENLMESVGDMSGVPPSHNLGPQRPKEGQNVPPPSDGYVRLELHFENGRLSVIGARNVAGPLIAPTAVIQGHVYEVLLDGQQIAIGSLPDVDVRRAFANRDVPDPQGKHRFVQVPAFDFTVRVPKAHITTANLQKMEIILHNVRAAPDRLTPVVELQKQPGVEAAELARLSGINLQEVPAEVRSQLEGIIRRE